MEGDKVTATKMAPLTEREMRMLLALLEAEVKECDATERLWADTEESDEHSAEGLAYEKGYATGRLSGARVTRDLILELLNAE